MRFFALLPGRFIRSYNAMSTVFNWGLFFKINVDSFVIRA